jgi:hypothetical protein
MSDKRIKEIKKNIFEQLRKQRNNPHREFPAIIKELKIICARSRIMKEI